MPVIVRSMRPEEARCFLEINRAAVRGIAAKDYPAAVVETWAPLPVTDTSIEWFLANYDDEIRLVAEVDGQLVGTGALVPSKSELRACYVVPTSAEHGVGAAIVGEIERIARERGLTHLELESSITAELFYAGLGYRAAEREEHHLISGVSMGTLKMRKQL
jgi:putative acetyltransferase